MTSSYARDPRVPPFHVEHLGKHHKTSEPAPIGLAPAHVVQPSADEGPSYEDFLQPDPGADERPDKAG